jgi:hypothetical protein
MNYRTLASAVLFCFGCAAEPTSLLVRVEAPAGLVVRTLEVTASVSGRSNPVSTFDHPVLPSRLLITVSGAPGPITVELTAVDEAGESLSAHKTVQLQSHKQSSMTLQLAPSATTPPPDGGTTVDADVVSAHDLSPGDMAPPDMATVDMAPSPDLTPEVDAGVVSLGTWYTIVNQNSHQCLDDQGGGTTDGTSVVQYGCRAGKTNQEWQFVPTDSGYYQILSRNANLILEVIGGEGATGDGVNVDLWDYVGGYNQQWMPVPLGGGYYKLVARHSGKCLDVPYSSTTANTVLWQWECNGTGAQAYSLTAQP